MKSIYSLNICIALFIFLFFPKVFSQDTGTNQKNYSVNLTDEKVKKCIKLLPEFIKTGVLTSDAKQNKQKLLGLQEKAIGVGFENYSEYLKSSSGLIMVYSYLQLKSNKQFLLEKIKKLNPEAQNLLKEQIDSIDKILAKYEKDISPESFKIVKKYIPQLDVLLKREKKSK